MKRIVVWGSKALATCFFLTYPLEALARRSGRKQTGAGLIGSLAGLACAGLLPTDVVSCLMVLLGGVALSVVVGEIAEESFGTKDDQRIVVDEWIGYLVSIALLPKAATILVSGLILFRIFDSWKPLGIKKLAVVRGGWGIVLDDLAAGVLSNILLRVALRVI